MAEQTEQKNVTEEDKVSFPKDATQQFVAIDSIHNDVVVLKGGVLRAVVMVAGVNFELKSEEEQDIITGGYQNFLNTLDFSLQIIIHSRKINIKNYLEKMKKIREQESNELLRNQISEYNKFIEEFVKENEIMTKNFFVVVPYDAGGVKEVKKGVSKFIPFISSKKKHNRSEETLEYKVGQLKQRVDQVLVGLERIGLRSVQLNKEELMELYYNLYNPENVEKELEHIPGAASPQQQAQ
jgi:hypothetical protein